MSKILNYDEFINELRVSDVSKEYKESENNSIEDLKNTISEYDSNKIKMDNIYKTAKSNDEIKQYLISSKLAEVNNKDGSVKITNPLLSLHSNISNINKQVIEIEEEIEVRKDELDSKKQLLSNLKNDSEGYSNLNNEIESIEEIMNNKSEKIKQLNLDYIELDKEIKNKLKEFKDKINLARN